MQRLDLEHRQQSRNGGLVIGRFIKPNLSLQPEPFRQGVPSLLADRRFHQGRLAPMPSGFICQLNDSIPKVIEAMRACVKRRQVHQSFSVLTSMLTIQLRGRSWQACLSQFGPLGKSCAFLVDDYVAGVPAITIARRSFPE